MNNIKSIKEGRYLGNLLDYIKEGKGKFIVKYRDIYEGVWKWFFTMNRRNIMIKIIYWI